MNKCKRKHKYKPRYNERYTTVIEEMSKQGSGCKIQDANTVVKPYLKEKAYVYDICVKCGDIKKGV